MKPGPSVLVTVMFKEYAPTGEGIPVQGPPSSAKLRETPAERAGAPNGPAGPRVSTIRHGVTPTNVRGRVTSPSVRIPPAFPGEVEPAEGTGQLDTVAPSCPSARAVRSGVKSIARKTAFDRGKKSPEVLIATSFVERSRNP